MASANTTKAYVWTVMLIFVFHFVAGRVGWTVMAWVGGWVDGKGCQVVVMDKVFPNQYLSASSGCFFLSQLLNYESFLFRAALVYKACADGHWVHLRRKDGAPRFVGRQGQSVCALW